tara:strand:- start:764 stop:952 length:189 start_codon:yes stop_codon:yes gene_type:complete
MEINDTEKEIISAIFHLPNNYALGKFIRDKYWPLYEEIISKNPDFDPKAALKIEKKFRGPWN